MDKRLRYLHALRNFESAARHQSYSKAASELFVSQAAVSQQIRLLEKSLGTKLFVRKNRKMLLTQPGDELYNATRQSFETLIQAFNNVQREDIAGTLSVTSTQSFASLWLMPRLHKFAAKHPDIKIKVLGSNQFENMRQAHIDLAIRAFSGDVQIKDPDFTCEFLGQDDFYPVCSPQTLNQMGIVQPKDILRCWLINQPRMGSIDWVSWFGKADVTEYESHDMHTDVTSIDLAINAVLTSTGFTLAPDTIFSQYIQSGTLVRPFDIKHPLSQKRYLVFDPNSAKYARLKIFISWLKEEMFE
jgi:LysR family glycine cleavage system transcriptional activator